MVDKKEKKKIRDLTGGAYQPSEQFKQVSDGTVVRLEDPTTPKTKEEIETEADEKNEESDSDDPE